MRRIIIAGFIGVFVSILVNGLVTLTAINKLEQAITDSNTVSNEPVIINELPVAVEEEQPELWDIYGVITVQPDGDKLVDYYCADCNEFVFISTLANDITNEYIIWHLDEHGDQTHREFSSVSDLNNYLINYIIDNNLNVVAYN
jgi:hypothetical protein